jgi:hypothetical protein
LFDVGALFFASSSPEFNPRPLNSQRFQRWTMSLELAAFPSLPQGLVERLRIKGYRYVEEVLRVKVTVLETCGLCILVHASLPNPPPPHPARRTRDPSSNTCWRRTMPALGLSGQEATELKAKLMEISEATQRCAKADAPPKAAPPTGLHLSSVSDMCEVRVD